MECLVRSDILLPPDFPADRRRELIASEVERGRELVAEGVIRRIWRVPGRWSAIALYEVGSPEQLHEAISSLPLWPWMEVSVTYLAGHLLEAETDADATDLAGRWR